MGGWTHGRSQKEKDAGTEYHDRTVQGETRATLKEAKGFNPVAWGNVRSK